MTPALDLLKKVRAEHRIHSYEHDPKAASYGLEAAEKLGLDPAQVFKTLLAASEKGELLVAVVPVAGSLDLKGLAHAAGVKKGRDGRPSRRAAFDRLFTWRHQPAGAEEAPAHFYRQFRTAARQYVCQCGTARLGSRVGAFGIEGAHRGDVC